MNTDGAGTPFDCRGESINRGLKAGTACAGSDCNTTTCCGMYSCCVLFIEFVVDVFGVVPWTRKQCGVDLFT